VDGLRQLRKWRKEQRLRLGPKYRDLEGSKALGLVFCLADGRPLHQNNIRERDHYPRLKRLGLPRIRLHDLRHAHGTRLIAAGVDARTVADRLGHSSPAFTMSVYVNGTNETQKTSCRDF
jgi:integrase